MNIEQVRKRIASKCRTLPGGVSEYARLAGVHRQAVDEAIRGQRHPAPDVLAFIGLERAPTTYRFIRKAP